MGEYQPIDGDSIDATDKTLTSGMKILPNVVDLETDAKLTVILRSITEDFWLKVIEATESSRICVVGTPGIGKTTTSCILIRQLLDQRKTVVYHVKTLREQGYVYMFIPSLERTRKIDVKVIQENEFNCLDDAVNRGDGNPIYYVVDPGNTRSIDCNPPSLFNGKVIIISSPDDGHWGGPQFSKQRVDVLGSFLYMPVWILDELLHARKHFAGNLSEEIIISRYEKVGGVPRHIFVKEFFFQGILQNQTSAINSLTDDQLKKLTSGDMESVQTGEKGQPKSLLMVYDSSADTSYRTCIVAISSKLVIAKLFQKNAEFMWNLMVSCGVDKGGVGWKIFETYCQNQMLEELQYPHYKYHDGQSIVLGPNDTSLTLGGCSCMEGTHKNLVAAAKERECVVFYSLNPYQKFIDFIYRRGTTYYAFQVTLAASHSCNPKDLSDFAEKAGGASKFLLHYLTIPKNYENFKLKPANPIAKLNEKGKWTVKMICMTPPVAPVYQTLHHM
jgi:hypothetical protein